MVVFAASNPHSFRTWTWATLLSVAIHVGGAAAVLSMPAMHAGGLGALNAPGKDEAPLLLLPVEPPKPPKPPEPLPPPPAEAPKPSPPTPILKPPELRLGNDAADSQRQTWLSSPAEGEHIARPSTIDQPSLTKDQRPEPPPAPPPTQASPASQPTPANAPPEAAAKPETPKGTKDGEEGVKDRPLPKLQASASPPKPVAPRPEATVPVGTGKPEDATVGEKAREGGKPDTQPAPLPAEEKREAPEGEKPVDAPLNERMSDTDAASAGAAAEAKARAEATKEEKDREGKAEAEIAALKAKGEERPSKDGQAQPAPSPTNPAPAAMPAEAVPPMPSGRGKPVTVDTDAWMADREADGSSIKRAANFRNGRVEAGHGLDIRTVRPIFTAVTRALSFPSPPIVEVKFDRTGVASRVRVIRSSGYDDVDGPIVNAVYQWKASGKELAQIGPEADAGLVMRITFLLN